MPSDFAGQVLTVTGPIDPGDLGVTMAHEHILLFLQNNPPIELGDLARESDHVNLYARTDGNTLLSMSNYGLRWDAPGAPKQCAKCRSTAARGSSSARAFINRNGRRSAFCA
jgi:predicted metal-dependent phosphotriesterase family hydrolase